MMSGRTGRALHLLDVEYLGLGPGLTADDLTLVLDRYRPRTDWHLGDHLVVASGDHLFGTVVDVAHDLGVEVWVAAYEFNLARSLAEAVDRVVDLTVAHALAA